MDEKQHVVEPELERNGRHPFDDGKQRVVDPELEKKVGSKYADAIRSGSVPEEVLKHAHDGDLALKALQGHGGQIIHIDEATNKRLLRRIDWNLIPVRLARAKLNECYYANYSL